MKGKKKRIGITAGCLLFAGICMIFMGRQKNTVESPGLFIWEIPAEEDLQGRKAVAEAVSSLNISEVYCASDRKAIVDRSLQGFVKEMSNQKADTWYLTGEAEWGLDPKGKEIRRVIKDIAKYNASVEIEAQFTGIMVDIEPYLTPEWEDDKDAVMELWCQSLIRARECAAENHLLLTICIPRWLDEINPDILEQMIAEGCDRAAVMNYGRENEAEAIAEEVAIADRYQKPVIHISELTRPGQHELTEKQTYYNDGIKAVTDSWKRLKKSYPKSDLHFAYHHLTPILELSD